MVWGVLPSLTRPLRADESCATAQFRDLIFQLVDDLFTIRNHVVNNQIHLIQTGFFQSLSDDVNGSALLTDDQYRFPSRNGICHHIGDRLGLSSSWGAVDDTASFLPRGDNRFFLRIISRFNVMALEF